MTVKDKVGRVRHIAFRLEADARVSRSAINALLRRAVEDALGADGYAASRPELTAFDGREGLVRVRHTHAAAVRGAWNGTHATREGPVTITTLGTSGTMRAARRKWLTGDAAVRRRPRK